MKSGIGALVLLLLLACGLSRPLGSLLLPATATPLPSSTPTDMPTQTPSPIPTATLTPTPTATPTPVPRLPAAVIPENLGVNIHFTSATQQVYDALADTGFGFVRMDLAWSAVELSQGNYDFSKYDTLVASMLQRHVRLILILDYGNRLYDDGQAPFTDAGRMAFARFAAAAASRYAGKGILWEIWNEPNLDKFWKPKSNLQDYASLAFTTAAAVRQADPSGLIIGPAVCCFGDQSTWSFMDMLGKVGVLGQFDAVSVHPYGISTPEKVGPDYTRLRLLLQKYSPGRNLAIISGEWGFSTKSMSDVEQAEFLVRSWLINLSDSIDLSIWYDWKDDCAAPANIECHFGLYDYYQNPKPSYWAARTLMHVLDGYTFSRQVDSPGANDYLLQFTRGEASILVAWTVSDPHFITLPVPAADVKATSMLGESLSLAQGGGDLTIEISQSPQYLYLGSRSIP